jgi:MFS family permease
MIGLGLILSGMVNSLWQFFITYALIEAVGLSGTFGIATAVTSRWFTRNRGLALGIVSSGVGLGYLFLVPGNERLISSLGWSQAFIICGIASGAIMVISDFFLRPAPQPSNPRRMKPASDSQNRAVIAPGPREMDLKQAIRSRPIIIMTAVFTGVFFCTQIVMVHLVNHATDIGFTPLVAATFISIIGISSVQAGC